MRVLFGYAVTAAALLLLLAAPAAAEFSILIYIGKSIPEGRSLHLHKGDTDLDFEGVSWKDKSFDPPIYYGVRASYWLDKARDWGVAIDFTHAKTILRETEVATVKGSRDGYRVGDREPVARSIQHFELSHGLNMLTLNGLRRFTPAGTRDLSPAGRLQCYTGLGAGISIPHVEAHFKHEKTGREEWTGEYQFAAGPVVNGMLGLNYDLTSDLSGVLEYKLSYADVRAQLNGGGYIDTQTYNHQFISGVAGNFSP